MENNDKVAGAIPAPPNGHEWWVLREPTASGVPMLRVQLRCFEYGDNRIVDYALADLTFIRSEEAAVKAVVEAAERIIARHQDAHLVENILDGLLGVYGREDRA